MSKDRVGTPGAFNRSKGGSRILGGHHVGRIEVEVTIADAPKIVEKGQLVSPSQPGSVWVSRTANGKEYLGVDGDRVHLMGSEDPELQFIKRANALLPITVREKLMKMGLLDGS